MSVRIECSLGIRSNVAKDEDVIVGSYISLPNHREFCNGVETVERTTGIIFTHRRTDEEMIEAIQEVSKKLRKEAEDYENKVLKILRFGDTLRCEKL